ncbi:DNA methyltransferase [Paucibacter sp. R3-3]|uniref:Methyltransferase n=1 Tax=Roseateles agri TaxID=3098619 RepID=A0ABU5DRZ4_9BURK|nr:DNA methyltransferase [Paucibacter sp. R3-3]MDY0749093.1 DNA methyltransferase [Paucibacter sp. R3-3]
MSLPLNRVLLGDCCRLLAELPPDCVDFVLTDPPYLVNYRDRSGRSLAGDREADWLEPAFAEVFRVMRPDTLCVSFYGWSRTDLFFRAWRRVGLRVAGHITFPKRYTSTTRLMRYQHESAYLLAKGEPPAPAEPIGDVIDWTYSGNKLHPTQKPLSVLTPLIQTFCRLGGLVLDPFTGSGSSLVAAQSVGRYFVGMEIDPAMHAVAERRLQGYRDAMLWSLLGEEFDPRVQGPRSSAVPAPRASLGRSAAREPRGMSVATAR